MTRVISSPLGVVTVTVAFAIDAPVTASVTCRRTVEFTVTVPGTVRFTNLPLGVGVICGWVQT